TAPRAAPCKSAASFWKQVLHDGWVSGTEVRRPTSAVRRPAAAGAAAGSLAVDANLPAPPLPPSARQTSDVGRRTSDSGLEIIFRPDPTVWDGRLHNNGCVQERPTPLPKD